MFLNFFFFFKDFIPDVWLTDKVLLVQYVLNKVRLKVSRSCCQKVYNQQHYIIIRVIACMETNNTLPHDSRLVMIVRSNSPRNNGMRGEGLLGDVQTLNFNMGMMEAEWRQQQFQRQRMQLLSMAIFLCFMVLFFDNTATERREQQRSRGINPFAHYYNENNQNEQGKGEMNETERQQSLQQFRTALSQDFFYQKDASPLNVSGIYAGNVSIIFDIHRE
jgi:hypothetical protein